MRIEIVNGNLDGADVSEAQLDERPLIIIEVSSDQISSMCSIVF
jgi:hypothetical protein